MKLTMWRVVVVLNMHTKFREKYSASSFLDSIDYFSRNFVCILRITTSRHMVSFIDFYFHFLFQISTIVRLRSLQ